MVCLIRIGFTTVLYGVCDLEVHPEHIPKQYKPHAQLAFKIKQVKIQHVQKSITTKHQLRFLILHGGNEGNCLHAPWSMPWGLEKQVEIYNFLIGCPLPRRQCVGALSKTKHTCTVIMMVFLKFFYLLFFSFFLF